MCVTARASLPGGKCRLVDDLAAHDPQGAGEGDPVGVVIAFARGLVHQVPDGVVDEQEAVEFLFGSAGVLRAQHEMRSAQVGFDFIQSGLSHPLVGHLKMTVRRILIRYLR